MMNSYKAVFLSHGGGPLPLLDDPGHREMVSCLEQIASMIPHPDALVVVSAHWEQRVPTITSGASSASVIVPCAEFFGFAVGGVLVLRAVGEFRYVGFFRHKREE